MIGGYTVVPSSIAGSAWRGGQGGQGRTRKGRTRAPGHAGLL